jgi:hypothetical protein
MRKSIICIVLISMYACSSIKNPVSNDSSKPKEVSASANNEKDGSTIEKAIVIKARNESDGVKSEYVILEKMFPKYRMKSQGSSSRGSKSYDIMTIVTADNVEKVVYFDITSFYGKF